MQIAPVRVSKESIALPETLQKGRSLKQALQLTLASHQTFNALATMKLQPCTLQAMQRWLHFRGFARIGWVKKSTYLLLARTSPLLGWGKGKHKRLCFPCRSLLPSIPRSEASSGLACNKGAKYKPRSSCTRSLWASGNLFSVQRLAFQLHATKTGGFLQPLCKETSAGTYMMGQGQQLRAPNLDQCEPLLTHVLPAWRRRGSWDW